MTLRQYIYRNHWTIGFIFQPIEDVINNRPLKVHWVKNTFSNRWFADPFILDVTDTEIHVLVEEYLDSTRLGRISHLRINRDDLSIVEITPILSLSTHLSFPAIHREGNKIYIYPENSHSGALKLYEYDPTKGVCTPCQTLCHEPLTDAIWTNVMGEPAIFSTSMPDPNGNTLTTYQSKNGCYQKEKEYTFDTDIARNAGDWFKVDDKIYRPAQDCSQVYGGAVLIQQVIPDPDKGLLFRTIRRIESAHLHYHTGCHTFNYYHGVGVVDANGLRRPRLASITASVSSIKRRLLS